MYLRTGLVRSEQLSFALHQVEMDCREFRKQHFAYLDDTLPGDTMAAAQRHIMVCDNCAAHDSMVRRSLMLVRNMSVIEPSAAFRERMQARLDEARAENQRSGSDIQRAASRRGDAPTPVLSDRGRNRAGLKLVNLESDSAQPDFVIATNRAGSRQPLIFSVAAASVLMVGTMFWRQPSASAASEAVAIQVAPVTVTEPAIDTTLQPIYISPGMVQAMATGNPMWPAAMMLDDTPAQLMNSEVTLVKSVRE